MATSGSSLTSRSRGKRRSRATHPVRLIKPNKTQLVAEKVRAPLQSQVLGPKPNCTKDCKTITFGSPRILESPRCGGALRHCQYLRNVDSSFLSLYLTSHVGVPGNEAADELAGRGCDLSNPSSNVFSHSEIHSLQRTKMNLTWRNPPAHHWYAA
ncbi:hypothetical protein TNCV_4584541 [Trichonephila clavipes]|nr:hypothetical protein TNCV_4584541 [Trichonephila clavipes]